MSYQKDGKIEASTYFEGASNVLKIALKVLFLPAVIGLVISIYLVIGSLFVASCLLLSSPFLLIAHYLFPQLPIQFGVGDPNIIIEWMIVLASFALGGICMRMVRSFGREFHYHVKRLGAKFCER